MFLNYLCLGWQLEILNPDGTPVEGVEVGVNADAVQGITASNGMARLAINTEEHAESLTINVSFENRQS